MDNTRSSLAKNTISPTHTVAASALALAIVAVLAVVARHTGLPVDAVAAAFVTVLRALVAPQS